jgi:phage terminase Nu1 subunit (DNA packaging protein)
MAKRRPILVSAGVIAAAFGCSERQVQRFAGLGMPRTERGQYEAIACIRWYTAKLRKEIEDASDGDGLEHEQRRFTKAKADLAEIELFEKRGQFIPRDIFKQHVAMHIGAVRQRFSRLPERIAPELEGEERGAIKAALMAHVRKTLTALATGSDVQRASLRGNNERKNS